MSIKGRVQVVHDDEQEEKIKQTAKKRVIRKLI